MAGSHAVTNLERPHGRHGAEMVAKLSHNRRSGWRDEFMCLVALPDWDATEDLEGSRGRNREATVFALKPTASLFKGGNIDALNPQRFHPDARADNIRNRVERADLVEMDVLRRGAVDFGFRNGDPCKNRKRVFLHKRRKRAGFNQGLDVPVRTLRRVGVCVAVTV